jgi:hypothetical protein
MSTIYLIHGFNVDDEGRGTVGWMKPILEEAGHKVVMIKYGWLWRVRVRLCNSRLAKVISSMAEPRSIAIGHSNGCDLIHRACMEGAPFKSVILFNPALDNDTKFPEQLSNISVFYSANDKATSLAKWIPFSKWGNMGTVGYRGEDPRVVNFNEEDITRKKMRHSDFSKYPNLFGQIVITLCSD